MRHLLITLVFASAVSLSQAADKSGIKVFVMPSTGHFPMLEDPPRFNRSLDSVVKRFQQ